MHLEGKHGRVVYRIVQSDDETPDSAKEILAARRKFDPPVSFEQMKADLEREIVIYALGQLRDEGLLTDEMYMTAVDIARKKMKEPRK